MKTVWPENEQARLQALRRYDILDTQAEQAYDDITRLAAYIAQTPIALISLIDENRQWFKSKIGFDASETPREMAFCGHAIATPEQPLIVHDATADARFFDNPLVTGEAHIRFYVGEPLVTSDQLALGTLCVMDTVPRQLNPQQLTALEALSRLVVAQLELRRHTAELRTITADQNIYLTHLEAYRTKLEEANIRLEAQSLTDKLTGIANRAGFDQRLEEEVMRCQRYGSSLSLLLVDVDRFKLYNDTYGHPAGDEALKTTAHAMQSVCRPIDFVARYGGEEFAVILPTTGRTGASVMAERLRQAVEQSPLAHGAVTVSIGVATLEPNSKDGALMIAQADKALYMAKRSGRNQIVHSDALPA